VPAGRPTVEQWRTCSDCQDRDTSVYGVAHWHVAHQLPFLKHCIEHGTSLQFRCGDCLGPLGAAGMDRLPGEHCMQCGSRKTHTFVRPTAPGYEGMADLC